MMSLDRSTMELFEALRKKLDLVQAYWYFVEHGADGYDCPLAQNTQKKFEARDLLKVKHLMSEALGKTKYYGE